MQSITLAKGPSAKACSLPRELAKLAEFIKERFPEEAASIDLNDPREIVEAAEELLDRLWRWER